MFKKEFWHRFEYQHIPVYIRPDGPDWFIPNSRGDEVIRNLDPTAPAIPDPDVTRFLNILPDNELVIYTGRSNHLKLEQLNELWFHLTNRCNLSCTHCLFTSSPTESLGLSLTQTLDIAAEAYRLGTRIFVLTGGEPFVHPDSEAIIHGLLRLKDSRVVVLTNGMNLPDMLKRKPFDLERFHLQISVDGTEEVHDRIRGKGAYRRLLHNLEWLRRQMVPYSLSMCVTAQNVEDMPAVVNVAASHGAANFHFLWHFIRGRALKDHRAPVDTVFVHLREAAAVAKDCHVSIDNIESLKTQVFAPRGTIHDGAGTAWESLAIGPDGRLYPSAALVGVPELSSDLSAGIETAWRQSPVLKNIRQATAANLSSPFRFLTGGGDLDHSYIHSQTFIGDDPYHPLYEKIMLWLLTEEAIKLPDDNPLPQMRLRMGEILESCGAHGKVALTHSNCLLAIPHENSLDVVKTFYKSAVGDRKADILNPVGYDEARIDHIPEAYRFRGYGCGSPVLDAAIQENEHIVDLGCGSGVECFVAARLVGKDGRVTGVDMLDPMLRLAAEGLAGVVENLGFANIEFRKGYLEALPLENESADVVLSNCVMNLSIHKRKAYAEIFRVLRPGGRMVISDVVCETEPDPVIRNDETLRGECIAGAMVQHHLMSLLTESGFVGIRLIKRFPYREIQGHSFFSLTYSAVKPKPSPPVRVIYRGPLPYLMTHHAVMLLPGKVEIITQDEAEQLGDQIFILDEMGGVTNVLAENTCACFLPPENQKKIEADPDVISLPPRQATGCMVCGAPITYGLQEERRRCTYCEKEFVTNSHCEKEHFVCDACHAADGLNVIQHVCTATRETDMIQLFMRIRQHPSMPANGPEHHALVPGIILSTYRNLGGGIPVSIIETGIRRGSSVAGGYCAFMGVCGAAVGVGIAFSLILEANPLTPKRRQIVQSVTQSILSEISSLKAARCCQRDSWIALTKAVTLSKRYLPISLEADFPMNCEQQHRNKECMGGACPLHRQQIKPVGIGMIHQL
jgi:MoaA/NifB/PqqE/SkfB family radical SAM enzyme/SAM-dependent methyltransferase